MIPTDHQKYDGSHISVVYFGVLALSLLKNLPPAAPFEEYLAGLWVSCGYKASVSYLHEESMANLAATYFALVIRKIFEMPALSQADKTAILNFVEQCQSPNGQFRATALSLSESSLRHTYAAHAIAALLNSDERSQTVNWIPASTEYILSCQNYDGGFGDRPLDESHAGLTYCALASLKIAGQLHRVNPRVISYLSKRQTKEGGHNGRPNKPTDVCYSFWVVASLKLLDLPIDPSNAGAATSYILGPGSDSLMGGFVKTPGESADPYHTTLALCALSLLGERSLAPLDATLTCTC